VSRRLRRPGRASRAAPRWRRRRPVGRRRREHGLGNGRPRRCDARVPRRDERRRRGADVRDRV